MKKTGGGPAADTTPIKERPSIQLEEDGGKKKTLERERRKKRAGKLMFRLIIWVERCDLF